jgi:hypothetical protein
MFVLDYEMRFHDLSMFTSHYVPSEQYRVERLKDGLRQELRQRMVAFKFEMIRGLRSLYKEGQQGQYGLGKRNDIDYTSNRPF